MSMQQPAPQPGWYPDPQIQGWQRYWDGRQWTSTTRPMPPKSTSHGKAGFIAAGVMVALFVGFGVVASLSNDDSSSSSNAGSGDSDEGNGFVAESMCEDWVEERLKSPSTADFSDEDHSGDNPWTVTGDVDSENSFGAMIRNSFTCKVKYVGDDRYQLVDLNMTGN